MDFLDELSRFWAQNPSEDEILGRAGSLGGMLAGPAWGKANEAKKKAADRLKALEGERIRRRVQELKPKLLKLASTLDREMSRRKLSRRALDFDDLLLTARTLLTENQAVRLALKQRYPVVIVDEFQDTNRLQADILALILEPVGREARLNQGQSPLEALERADGRLVVLGDPKQSIYRFRGADVSVFNQLKNAAPAGGLIPLETNFRSQERLVDFFNEFFPTVMENGRDYATPYGPDDRQKAVRSDLDDGPGAELLVVPPGANARETRENEAHVLAARLIEILQKNLVKVGAGREPAPGDVAILLRRFTHLKAYEQGLSKAGLPFHTVRGQGFYDCPEVLHLVNLLIFLADNSHTPALLGVLRSPLIGLNDELLTRLAQSAGDRGLGGFFVNRPLPLPESLTSEEAQQVARARQFLAGLSARAGWAFPAELLESAVEASDYLAVLLTGPQGPQQTANVQRLIEVVRQWPGRRLFPPGEMAAILSRRLSGAGTDPEAQAGIEEDRVVKIMTIHQAKGLQFPIVVLPDMGNPIKFNDKFPLVFGPGGSFALRAKDLARQETLKPWDYELFAADDQDRERSESQRLLYVAATRAEDHLIFVGSPDKRSKNSWLPRLMDFGRERPDILSVEVISAEPGPGEEPYSPALEQQLESVGQTANADEAASDLKRRVFGPASAGENRLRINVTALNQLIHCPAGYWLEYILGLPAAGSVWNGSGAAGGLDPRQKGNLFHFLMETCELSAEPEADAFRQTAELWAQAQNLEVSPDDLRDAAVKAAGFLQSDWGRDLRRSRGGLVWREHPFWLEVKAERPGGPKLLITGEIDLFFVTPEGRARLVDYKFTRPEKAEFYWPQLRTYALALKRSGLAGPLEAGLYFAGNTDEILVKLDLAPDWDQDWTRRLNRAARDLWLMSTGGFDPRAGECPDRHCPRRYACEVEAG